MAASIGMSPKSGIGQFGGCSGVLVEGNVGVVKVWGNEIIVKG